jgi:hypothetical protein
MSFIVTPAKAGVSSGRIETFRPEIPAFAGMTASRVTPAFAGPRV